MLASLKIEMPAIRRLFSLHGRMNRMRFFLLSLFYSSAIIIVYYLLSIILLEDIGIESYFKLKLLLGIVYLVVFTPIIVQQFHDINLSGYWVLWFWIAYPFSLRNIIVSSELWGLGIDVNSFWFLILILGVIEIILLFILFLKSGVKNDNRWGSLDKPVANPFRQKLPIC